MVIFAFNLRFCMEVCIIKIALNLKFWILNDHSFSMMYETILIVFFVLLTSHFAFKYNPSNFLKLLLFLKKLCYSIFCIFTLFSLFLHFYICSSGQSPEFLLFCLLFILLFGRNGVYCPILKIQVSKLV